MSVMVWDERQRVLGDIIPGAILKDSALVVGGAAVTGLSAQISLITPLSPVPFTLQTLAVLVVGTALGSARGVMSMTLYAIAGVAGIPWFAGHSSGWGGAAFGYILGFIAAAGVVGMFARRGADRTVLGTACQMITGVIVIYVFGATWLAVAGNLGMVEAVRLGVVPFIGADAVKVAAAICGLPALWKVLKRFGCQ